MDSVTVVLVVVVLLLLLAILIILLRSKGQAPADRHLQDQVVSLRAELAAAEANQAARGTDLHQLLETRLANLTASASQDAAMRMRTEAATREELQRTLGERLADMEHKVGELAQMQGANFVQMRRDNALELEKLRASNEAALEKMRATVDEKLQGTLEKRLGESFQLVSDRLEQVQRGLGEMHTLANDVGGLKKVLTNVKTRGTWGEVQLSRQLSDIMTHEQYAENVEIVPSSGERVEFAVRLPGRSDEQSVYLPIDSKLPQEPYERLLEAQEEGDATQIAAATKALERALHLQATTIRSKYVHAPHSTDFAVMYLPTEGLFAEVIRIPGLAADLQRKQRVIVTGPTTLMSLLNSLQMGFKTLAIEQRSAEVWQVLAAAKTEFGKYIDVWEKLGRQLKTAQNTVEEAGRRTRAVEKKLQVVEDWTAPREALVGDSSDSSRGQTGHL